MTSRIVRNLSLNLIGMYTYRLHTILVMRHIFALLEVRHKIDWKNGSSVFFENSNVSWRLISAPDNTKHRPTGFIQLSRKLKLSGNGDSLILRILATVSNRTSCFPHEDNCTYSVSILRHQKGLSLNDWMKCTEKEAGKERWIEQNSHWDRSKSVE